jgi:lysophospholipase L1-like esterase
LSPVLFFTARLKRLLKHGAGVNVGCPGSINDCLGGMSFARVHNARAACLVGFMDSIRSVRFFRSRSATLPFLLLSASVVAASPSNELPVIPRGGKLVLFGDSITAYGDRPDGWVRILRNKLAGELERPDIRIVNAGQGGDVVQDLHRRFFWRTWRSPDLVVLCIGINDARRAAGLGYTDLDLKEYREGLDSLITKLQGRGPKVVVVSPIVSGEQMRGRNALDSVVDAYARTAGEVAERRGVLFIDLRSIFFDRLASANIGDKSFGVLTYDGLHLNEAGNALMAEAVLGKLRSLTPAKANP